MNGVVWHGGMRSMNADSPEKNKIVFHAVVLKRGHPEETGAKRSVTEGSLSIARPVKCLGG